MKTRRDKAAGHVVRRQNLEPIPEVKSENAKASPELSVDLPSNAKAALQALALQARTETGEGTSTKGAQAVEFGAQLMRAGTDEDKPSWKKRAAAFSALGLSLVGVVQPAVADTVFLDFNNGVKEIETARKMATRSGEEFHLVRPTTQALDSVFAKAERGEIDITTLVMSGHSGGTSVWGSGPNGESLDASLDDFKKLKEKYPKAFDQVEHVFMMACYAGGRGNSAEWNSIFHNARAIVGFSGSGPASHRPASSWVLKNVERALDALPDATLSPQAALRKAKEISRLKGPRDTLFAIRLDGVHHQHGQKHTNADLVLERVSLNRNQVFTPYFDATHGHEMPPTNHHSSPLRDFYNQLQDAVNHAEPGSVEYSQIQTEVKTTIRLIYFDNITKNVELHHRSDFDAANKELKTLGANFQIPKDLKTLNRADILKLEAKLAAINNPDMVVEIARESPALLKVVSPWMESLGFEKLSTEGIDTSWQLRNFTNNLADVIAATGFSAEESALITGWQSEFNTLKSAKKSEIESHLTQAATDIVDDARSRYGEFFEVPDGDLNLRQLRQLGERAREGSSDESRTGIQRSALRRLGEDLDMVVGRRGNNVKDIAGSLLIAQRASQLETLNTKLEWLGIDARVDTTDAGSVRRSLSNVVRAIESHKGVPPAVQAAFKTFKAAMETHEDSAIEVVQKVFTDGLRALDAEAIPDNWVTD